MKIRKRSFGLGGVELARGPASTDSQLQEEPHRDQNQKTRKDNAPVRVPPRKLKRSEDQVYEGTDDCRL